MTRVFAELVRSLVSPGVDGNKASGFQVDDFDRAGAGERACCRRSRRACARWRIGCPDFLMVGNDHAIGTRRVGAETGGNSAGNDVCAVADEICLKVLGKRVVLGIDDIDRIVCAVSQDVSMDRWVHEADVEGVKPSCVKSATPAKSAGYA